MFHKDLKLQYYKFLPIYKNFHKINRAYLELKKFTAFTASMCKTKRNVYFQLSLRATIKVLKLNPSV